MRGNRPLVAVGVALLLVLAGCTGGGNAGNGATQAALGGDGAEYEQATGTPAEADDGGSGASDRMRIYTAELAVRVDEFAPSRSNLSAAVEAHGGYVGNSQVSTSEWDDATYRDGRFTYRVPAENYSAFLEDVREEGTVLREEENVQDVTGQHADLEARLANLRAERDRLRELYEQANDTEDVLAVQRELSDVQGEIESTEARLETLENRVAYATVTVELREERPDDPVDTENWYDTGVIAAFLESVDGALVALRAAVVGIAYALPYLIAFGVPLFGLGLVFKRYVVGRGSIRGGGGEPLAGEGAEGGDEPPNDSEE
ncbi:DUF4349 domain-containing protein [Halolamina sp. CBA1230]|uniref:DUF4349 domain-containing protein n=1 Tax=Halolamina sp. CBA1230 TaxID=1853690 RepID=UPI0009A2057D|nr:DUF4349 domain-containing protein [Halolamina sp. CBA1230]QKY19470.1 DUF4349 domain-containing protein [Halolamina sp. CBA1230]